MCLREEEKKRGSETSVTHPSSMNRGGQKAACLHEELDAVERRGDRLGDGARPRAGREERDAAGHQRQQCQGVLQQLRHRWHLALRPGDHLSQRSLLLSHIPRLDGGRPGVTDGEGREGPGRVGAAPRVTRAEEESRRVRGRGRRAPGVACLHSPVAHRVVWRREAGGCLDLRARGNRRNLGGGMERREGIRGARVVKPRGGNRNWQWHGTNDY